MANDIQLIQDKQGNNVFPITHERAVRDSSGTTIETKLASISNKLTKTVLSTRNILDPTTVKKGYVRKDNGNFASNNSYRCSDFIELDGKPLSCNRVTQSFGSYGCTLCLYNADKQFVGYLSTVNKAAPTVLDPCRYGKNTKYVRFNFGPESAFDEGGSMEGQYYAVYRLGYVPDYEPYGTTTEDAYLTPKVELDECEFIENEYGKNRCGPVLDSNQASSLSTTTGGLAAGGVGILGITDYIEVQGHDLVCNKVTDIQTSAWVAYDADYQKTHTSNDGGELRAVYRYQEGDAYVRFGLSSIENVQVEIGTSSTSYVPFSVKQVIKKSVIPPVDISEGLPDALASQKIYPNTFEMLLPSKFYAVVGDTLQLFFKSIVVAVDPLIRWVKSTCNKGKQYRRYFEYTPKSGESGNYSLSCSVYDDNLHLLSSGTSTIKVVNAPTSPATMKHILAIGSSTTDGGEWVCEAQRRLLASDGTPTGAGISNVAFVGRKSKTRYGQTAGFEAQSGWSWKDYSTVGRAGTSYRFYLVGEPTLDIGNVYTNNNHSYTVTEINTIDNVLTILCDTTTAGNTPTASGTLVLTEGSGDASIEFSSYEQGSANPFWDTVNSKLSFQPYVDTYCGGTVDIVYAMLGVNGLFNMSIDTQRGHIVDFVEALHEEYPNCKVVLVASTVPSVVNMMPGYGAGTQYANVYATKVRLFSLYAMYKELESEYDYVEFESWSAQFDSDYNFPLTQKAVNTRNSTITEPYANNTVHAGLSGYMQYADAAYRSVVAHFCQGS